MDDKEKIIAQTVRILKIFNLLLILIFYYNLH